MPQRLVKRNASLCVSLAAIWLVFSFLAGALKNASPNMSWNVPIIIWGIQLIFFAGVIYFSKTETPTLTYWIGDVHGYASAVISIDILPDMLQEFALLIPELTDAIIQNIMTEMQKESDGVSITIPIKFYHRPEKLLIYSNDEEKILEEHFEEGKIGLIISTHVDLANEIQTLFDAYTESLS